MQRYLAFVLGGGGARGALQVGALRALIEAGFVPDLLVGTSIGAVNATGLALWGVDLTGIEMLEEAYQKVAESKLINPHLTRLILIAMAGHQNRQDSHRVSEFFVSLGLKPDLRFKQIKNVRLALISADLTSGQPIIFGQNPDQMILDGLMASIALPPWFAPVEIGSRLIVDGGVLSNLPIEPALNMGATEIIALDIDDPNAITGNDNSLSQYFGKMMFAIHRRHIRLESALAHTQGVTVQRIELRNVQPTPTWDFSNCQQLFRVGYGIAKKEISGWTKTRQEDTFYQTESANIGKVEVFTEPKEYHPVRFDRKTYQDL